MKQGGLGNTQQWAGKQRSEPDTAKALNVANPDDDDDDGIHSCSQNWNECESFFVKENDVFFWSSIQA